MNKNEQNRVVAWRLKFLREAAEMPRSVAQTCRHFGLSRKTFYKWKARYKGSCRHYSAPTSEAERALFTITRATTVQAGWRSSARRYELGARPESAGIMAIGILGRMSHAAILTTD
jgi:hypothetical protein